MLKNKVKNATFNNSQYYPGGGFLKRLAWYYINCFIFNSYLFPVYAPKILILRLFGAKVGKGLVIKPNVNIKYPWFLAIGDNVWIGEGVWIDNLAKVNIGDDVCLSQKTHILTGSHDYTSTSFELIVKEISIESGVWACAGSVILPGSVLGTHCVILPYSLVSGRIEEYSIVKLSEKRIVGRRIIT